MEEVHIKKGSLNEVYEVFKKLGNTVDPCARWDISIGQIELEPYVKSLKASIVPPDIVTTLRSGRGLIYSKHGQEVKGTDGNVVYRIPNECAGLVARLISEFEEANKDAVEEESRYLESVEKLMDETVALSIPKILHSWCGELINANELKVLIENNLIVRDA
jgi:hypothetical protein